MAELVKEQLLDCSMKLEELYTLAAVEEPLELLILILVLVLYRDLVEKAAAAREATTRETEPLEHQTPVAVVEEPEEPVIEMTTVAEHLDQEVLESLSLVGITHKEVLKCLEKH